MEQPVKLDCTPVQLVTSLALSEFSFIGLKRKKQEIKISVKLKAFTLPRGRINYCPFMQHDIVSVLNVLVCGKLRHITSLSLVPTLFFLF